MATINNLYPPIVDTYMPAFTHNSGNGLSTLFTINFSISDFTDMTLIKEIQIVMKDQVGSKNVFKNAGYYFLPVNRISGWNINKRNYSIQIPLSAVKNDMLKNDKYYRIQMRFSTSNILGSLVEAETQAQKNYLNSYVDSFSEWSNISLIKMIPKNTIEFTNSHFGGGSRPCYLTNLNNLSGSLSFEQKSNEYLYSYRVRIYQFDSSYGTIPPVSKINTGFYDEACLIEDSGVLLNKTQSQNTFNYIIKTSFQQNIGYVLLFDYETSNRYRSQINQLFYLISGSTTDYLNNSILAFKGYSNPEKGCNILNAVFRDNTLFSGTLIIRRASSKNNYSVWEDIDIKHFSNIKNYRYEDYTVESGVFYKYMIQQRNDSGDRGAPVYLGCRYEHQTKINNPDKTLILELSDVFLGDKNGNLKLQYNVTVDGLQEKTSDSIVTTIGSKFPFVFRGGKAKYRTFNLSGLIAYEMDAYEYKESDASHFSTMVHVPATTKTIFTDEDGREYTPYNYEERFNEKTQEIEFKTLYIDNPNLMFNTERTREEIEILFGEDYNLCFIEDYSDERRCPVQEMTIVVDNEHLESLDSVNLQHVFADKIKVFNNYESIVEEYETYKKSIGMSDHYDFTLERFYRKKVFDFLNDGNLKLFRSASEGNILVRLTDVSLAPFDGTQRLVWTFSATATEMDNTNSLILSQYNVIDNKVFEELGELEVPKTDNDYYTQNEKGEYVKVEEILTKNRILGQARFDQKDFKRGTAIDVMTELRKKYNKILNNISSSVANIPYLRVDFKRYATGDVFGTDNNTVQLKINNEIILLSQTNPYIELKDIDVSSFYIDKKTNVGEGYIIIDYVVELNLIPYVYEDKSRTYLTNQIGEIRYLKENMFEEKIFTKADNTKSVICYLRKDFDFFEYLLSKYKYSFNSISFKLKTLKKVIFKSFNLSKNGNSNELVERTPISKALFAVCDLNDIHANEKDSVNRYYHATNENGYLELYDKTVPSINSIEFAGVLGTPISSIHGAQLVAKDKELKYNETSDFYKIDFDTLSLYLTDLPEEEAIDDDMVLKMTMYTEPKKWAVSRVIKHKVKNGITIYDIAPNAEEKYLTISIHTYSTQDKSFNFSLSSDADSDVFKDFATINGLPYLDLFGEPGQEKWEDEHCFPSLERMALNEDAKPGHIYRVGNVNAREDLFVSKGLDGKRMLVLNTDKIKDTIGTFDFNSINFSSNYFSCETPFTIKDVNTTYQNNIIQDMTIAFYDFLKFSSTETRLFNINFQKKANKDGSWYWQTRSLYQYSSEWVKEKDSSYFIYNKGFTSSQNPLVEIFKKRGALFPLGDHCTEVETDLSAYKNEGIVGSDEKNPFDAIQDGFFRILINTTTVNDRVIDLITAYTFNLSLYRKNYTYNIKKIASGSSFKVELRKRDGESEPSLIIDENNKIWAYGKDGNPKALSKDELFVVQFDKDKNLYYYYNDKYYKCRYIPIYDKDDKKAKEMLAIEMPIDINFTYFFEHCRKETF